MIFLTRWSAKRLREIADSLNDDKRTILSKSSFCDLMYISPFAAPPQQLVDFVAMRIDTKKRKFKLNNKTIIFSKDMVKKIFNVPSGDRPVKLLKRGEKSEFRELYLDGIRFPVAYTTKILTDAADDDAETVERSWILLCLALVLAPGTGNMVPIEYAGSLQDMGKALEEFAWDEHILDDLMKEVKIYQEKRLQYQDSGKPFNIGSCLPILPVIYMDHISIPRGCIVDHNNNYSLPRMCFVTDLDFSAVIAVDTNNLDLHNEFGKRNFLALSTTPYAVSSFKSYIDQLIEINQPEGAVDHITQSSELGGSVATQKPLPDVPESSCKQPAPPPANTEHGDEVCGSLEEWLHQLPSMNDLELQPHLQALYEKHRDLYGMELKAALNSLGSTLQTMFCKRMGLLLSDAHKAGPNMKEQKDEGDGVTFNVPRASTATGTAGSNEPNLDADLQPPKSDSRSADCGDIVVEAGRNIMGDRNTEQAELGRNIMGDCNTEQNKCASNVSAAQHPEHSNLKDEWNKGKSSEWEHLAHVNLTRRESTLEEGGSFGLFEEGSEEDLYFKGESPIRCPSSPGSPSNFLVARRFSEKPLFDETPKDYQVPQRMPSPVYDVTPISTKLPLSTGPAEAGVGDTKEVATEVNSGRNPDEKKPNKKKRIAKAQENVPKMKKIKLDPVEDALYRQFVDTRYKIKKPRRDEALPPFIRIGGFETSYQHFSDAFKKRAHLNNEAMCLYIESFNMEHAASTNRPRKQAFPVHFCSKLTVEPNSFETKSCYKEFRKICETNKRLGSELMFFTIVGKQHWAVVVANLPLKQFNIFDSVIQPSGLCMLEDECCRLITNFKTLAREGNPWNIDFDSFKRFSPEKYPRQTSSFDCGFFSMLYLENFTGKAMKSFETDNKTMLNFRKYVAAKLLQHPFNKLDPDEELKKLLESS